MQQQDNFESKNNSPNHVSEMYQNWFLDYASYVILERAVPAITDGLKPVQRRILHALKEMDDGRFNKVANVIGQTMQYHPHGDASIGDALVNIGQKELLFDTQGNWGDVRTGDNAAAPRYIEVRLSKFANEIAFNPKTTQWQLSYDGRKNEPIALPVKFPLLLAQGTEGIAVGLSTKILPHNFCELIESSILHLKGKKFQLFPDFSTAGIIDVSNYNDGKRGGKIRVRVGIEKVDSKTLRIKDVPWGLTTGALIESIVKANEQVKIKIKKVTDNTAQQVDIEIQLAQGVTPDQTIDALYAFTHCETSISPNACVIVGDKPHFLTISEILKLNTEHTKQLLQQELIIKLKELNDKWHYTSLEKIFFEEKIYKELEKKHETWELVLHNIQKAFIPYLKYFKQEITPDDIVKLTEKPVRRIYKLDIDELNTQIKNIEEEIKTTQNHLDHLIVYTISYFEELLKKYGKGKERRTEIKIFDHIQIADIAITNTKLYINKQEGFIGTSLKKDEFLMDCADIDHIIAFTKEGKMKIVKVAEKIFIGKNIIHAELFKKNDNRTTFNVIYTDGKTGIAFAKRFNVTGITRDKEYDITKGTPQSKILYFTSNPNAESEIVTIQLSPACKAKIKQLDFDFNDLAIKARTSMGNQVTKYPIKSIKQKTKGISTLGGKKISYDDIIGRLTYEQKGIYLGEFTDNDRIIVFYNNGNYTITNTELTNRYDNDNLILIQKFDPTHIFTAIYFDNEKQQFNIKRFKIEATTLNTQYLMIKEGQGNYLEWISTHPNPTLLIKTGKKKFLPSDHEINANTFVDIMGWKAIGNKLCGKDLIEITLKPTHHQSETPQTQLFS